GIVGDARAVLLGLLRLIETRERSGWDAVLPLAKAARPTRPEWLIETLRETLPPEAVVFTDACELGYRMHTDWVARGPRRFFYPSNFITLGWGFPAAIGGAVGLEGAAPVVSVSGDGGFLMTAQELATAARYALRLIVVVHNDSVYGAIKNIQTRDHDGRHRDVDLNNPDFVALASAFGVPATRAPDAPEFAEAIQVALRRNGPSLIEVPDRWRPIRAGA
ncbi:MAG: thiamine pyrophosphate-dependent enzyme, partial [Isosphaeraceae bacterium]